MYSLQQDSHGNRIVCKDMRARTNYRIVYRGDYQTCLRYKIAPRGWDVIEGGFEGTSLEIDRSSPILDTTSQ